MSKRGLFQLHLSTYFLLMLTLSALLFIDVVVIQNRFEIQSYFENRWVWFGLGLFHIFSLASVAIASEWIISSRRDAHKR